MAVDLSVEARDITRTSFIGKDFDTYVDDIRTFIQGRFPPVLFNNFVASELGVMLIEAMAYSLSNLSWFTDRQADELYLETARLPFSVSLITRLIGQVVPSAVASSVDVEYTLNVGQPFQSTIAVGTQLSGPEGLIFEAADVVIFAPFEVGTKVGTAREGETVEEVFTANGEANQTVLLTQVPFGKGISWGSVTVTVDAVPWTVVDYFDFVQTNQAKRELTEDPPRLRFGNGVAGNIPLADQEIRVTYLATSGINGNVPANTITAFSEPFVVAFTQVPFLVNNPTAAGGGSNREDIEKTKSLAPKVFAAAERLVTEPDYDAVASKFVSGAFGAVAIAKAIIARSFDEDAETRTLIQLIENQCGAITPDVVARLETHWDSVLSSNCKANLVSVRILTKDITGKYLGASLGLVNALNTFLNSRKESTVNVRVTTGEIDLYEVDVTVSVRVLDNFVVSTVLNDAKNNVEAELLGRQFGDSLRQNDLVAIVENTAGVDFSIVTITAPATKLVGGDVIISPFEILTKGAVTAVAI